MLPLPLRTSDSSFWPSEAMPFRRRYSSSSLISSPMLPLPGLDAGQQVVHAGDDGLERFQQVGALRHQLGNILALLAAQFGAGLDGARILAARDVDEFVAEQVGGGDGRDGIDRDIGQELAA